MGPRPARGSSWIWAAAACGLSIALAWPPAGDGQERSCRGTDEGVGDQSPWDLCWVTGRCAGQEGSEEYGHTESAPLAPWALRVPALGLLQSHVVSTVRGGPCGPRAESAERGLLREGHRGVARALAAGSRRPGVMPSASGSALRGSQALSWSLRFPIC